MICNTIGARPAAALALLCLALPIAAQGQTTLTPDIDPPQVFTKPEFIDSGWVENTNPSPAAQGVPAVVWSRVVSSIGGVAWMRLNYQGVKLSGGDAPDGTASFLRITSLFDGGQQLQWGMHVQQWQSKSAYFNGDGVLVELMAYPGTGQSRVVIDELILAALPPGVDTICGPDDNRVRSFDNRVGRNAPGGCTAWIIDDCQKCILTAGHCLGSTDSVHFNVPLSTNGGSRQNPPPEDQYPYDPTSVQGYGSGVGDDWGYFGLFPNFLGETPYQRQGNVAFTLAQPYPANQADLIRITGNGSVGSAAGINLPGNLNLVQKTHTGPYMSANGTAVRYRPDTTGGNSGSPVIYENTGEAIGIHTHGGCNSTNTSSSNAGTGMDNSPLQNALANPQGICECPGFGFNFPGGEPRFVGANAGKVQFTAVAANGATPQPGTGRLFVDIGDGAGFVATPVVSLGPNQYEATLPTLTCYQEIRFYLEADNTTGGTASYPEQAPNQFLTAQAAASFSTEAADSFDFGLAPWTVANGTGQSGGAWVQATPVGNAGQRQDPAADSDGSGSCWVTGNGFNDDVDGAATALTSTVFDLTGTTAPTIQVDYWIQSEGGSDDALLVELTSDGGLSWRTVGAFRDSSDWTTLSIPVKELFRTPGPTQIRFTVADPNDDSVTEAAVDNLMIVDLGCDRARWSTFGFPCIGGGSTPLLITSDVPSLGATFTGQVLNMPSNNPGFMVVGASASVWNGVVLPRSLDFLGAPNCWSYVSVDQLQPLPVTGTVGSWSVAIPNNASLAGVTFYHQAIGFTVAAPNALGLVASNAAEGVIY